jgi:hypothetical protein
MTYLPLLQGLLYCGNCGRPYCFSAGANEPNDPYPDAYICEGADSSSGCTSPTVPASALDKAIWHNVQSLLRQLEFSDSGTTEPVVQRKIVRKMISRIEIHHDGIRVLYYWAGSSGSVKTPPVNAISWQ